MVSLIILRLIKIYFVNIFSEKMELIWLKKVLIKKWASYLTYLCIIIIVIYLLKIITNQYEKQLLLFYKNIVELFFNNKHLYDPKIGFVEASGTYIIGKECLGLNFIFLMFITFSIAIYKYLKGFLIILGSVLSLIAAFILGSFSNIVRLLGSIYFVSWEKFELIHTTIGITINLFVLTISYIFIEWILKNNFSNKGEKNE